MKSNQEIDFVILWVDGNDLLWQAEKRKYLQEGREKVGSVFFEKWVDHPMRYRDWDNLQYWFRGVERFAPWVHKIHFVTWGHLPTWLNTDHPKLNIVNHRDFIPEKYLPTFQANPIENNLHRITGLTEEFVYFNDDMFIIRPTKPADFFVEGLPCDCAILDMPKAVRYGTPCEIKSAEILNEYFQKRTVIKQNWRKWLTTKYSTQLIRTLLLLPWKSFGCLFQPHLPSSFLKSTFQKLWEIEYDALDKTCREKFRGKEQLTQYLFLDWQRVTGNFKPRSPKIGQAFVLGQGNFAQRMCEYTQAIDYITKQRGKMVCLNDGDMTNEEFESRKSGLQQAFQSILPEKSSFEVRLDVNRGGVTRPLINLNQRLAVATFQDWRDAA